jgi:hypothetical protein
MHDLRAALDAAGPCGRAAPVGGHHRARPAAAAGLVPRERQRSRAPPEVAVRTAALGDGQVLDDLRADGFAIPDGAASDQR